MSRRSGNKIVQESPVDDRACRVTISARPVGLARGAGDSPIHRSRSLSPCTNVSLEECMNERRIHQIFEVSVLLKGAHALIECIGGLVLTFVSTRTITSLVNSLTQEELIEDP